MEIAGGLYHELVEVPQQHSIYGSGGRAAIAVSALTDRCILHTYSSRDRQRGIEQLKRLGIDTRVQEVASGVAFAYFHPLAQPHIEPAIKSIPRQPPLGVSGKAVLRFGMLEGSAIVDAVRAVYDPQSCGAIERFHANSSRAGKLAMVLNEAELCLLAADCILESAANKVIRTEGLSALVVKRGVKGALCFAPDGAVHNIPAYQTNKVTKIGTGDVFSAIFAYYWAEEERPLAEAAALASKTVAAYSLSGSLPAAPDLIDDHQAIQAVGRAIVFLEGANEGLGQRYVLEQAKNSLVELGLRVHCPAIIRSQTASEEQPTALLFVASSDSQSIDLGLKRADELDLPAIILVDGDTSIYDNYKPMHRKFLCDDFTTAIYNAGWAALR